MRRMFSNTCGAIRFATSLAVSGSRAPISLAANAVQYLISGAGTVDPEPEPVADWSCEMASEGSVEIFSTPATERIRASQAPTWMSASESCSPRRYVPASPPHSVSIRGNEGNDARWCARTFVRCNRVDELLQRLHILDMVFGKSLRLLRFSVP